MSNFGKTTEHTDRKQKNLSMEQAHSVSFIWKVISLLANFPAPNYLKGVGNLTNRKTVIISAIAVIISPLVSLYVLFNHAPVILGEDHSKIYYFLPLVVLIIELEIMGNRWVEKGGVIWSLVIGRLLLVAISLFFALGASLSSERENLQKSLQRYETQAVFKDPEIKAKYDFYTQQIANYHATVLDNETRYQERAPLARKLAIYQRLAWLEENGHSGIDEETGVYIKGGKECGTSCKTYLRDASTVKTRIAELDALPVANEALQQKIRATTNYQQLLLNSKLSDPNSLGSLIEGVFYADIGVQIKILFMMIAILTLELSPILVAFTTPSKNLLTAEKYQTEDDEISLSYVSKSRKAEIYARHAVSRTKFSSDFSPIIVKNNYGKAKQDNNDQINEQGTKVA